MVTQAEIQHRSRKGRGAKSTGPALFVVPALILGFILPYYFDVAGLRLGGYRIILILLFFPAIIRWLDGSDRIRAIDILMVCFALWGALAILVNHGFSQWEFIGIRIIETLSPYFIARWVIRDADAFRFFTLWLFIAVLLMLPFSIHQNNTNRSILLDFFGNFGDVYRTVQHEPRLGLYRAQGSLPHPILYGLFCSPVFALAWYVLGYDRSISYKLPRVGLVALAVFSSLSSGAWLSVAVQFALMMWSTVLSTVKKKWNLLLYMFAGMYVFIEIFSNRSPAQIFASYLTLKPSTAWNRIHIFNNVTDDIMRNPVFGIGLNDWTRPRWMLASVDNFWLVLAMRNGILGFVLLLAPVILIFRDVGRAPLTGRLASYRLGYLFSLAGMCVAAISVHLWDAIFCLLMFILGAGIWFIDARDESDVEQSEPVSGRERRIRYTRFE